MKNLDNIEHIENSKDCDLENQILFEDGQSTIGYFLAILYGIKLSGNFLPLKNLNQPKM